MYHKFPIWKYQILQIWLTWVFMDKSLSRYSPRFLRESLLLTTVSPSLFISRFAFCLVNSKIMNSVLSEFIVSLLLFIHSIILRIHFSKYLKQSFRLSILSGSLWGYQPCFCRQTEVEGLRIAKYQELPVTFPPLQ